MLIPNCQGEASALQKIIECRGDHNVIYLYPKREAYCEA